MLKRLMLMLGLALALGGVMVQPALARPAHLATPARAAIGASCTFADSLTWYDGAWRFAGYADNCFHVNAVNFQASNVNCACADWTDVTRGGTIHFAVNGGGIAGSTSGPERVSFTVPVAWAVVPWGSGCGAPPFQVYKVWHVKIHNTLQNTWSGTWTRLQGQPEWIC